jgi:hypothetical protein
MLALLGLGVHVPSALNCLQLDLRGMKCSFRCPGSSPTVVIRLRIYFNVSKSERAIRVSGRGLIQVGVNVARSSKKKNPLRQSQWLPVGRGQCPSRAVRCTRVGFKVKKEI